MTITAVMRLDTFPNGNPKPNQKADVQAAHNQLRDRDPRELSVEDLASIGHEKRPLLAIIRQNCIECQGGHQGEVRACRATGCVFWPYRMGATPFVSESRREAGRRLAALSRSKSPDVSGSFSDEGAEGI